MIVIEFPFSCIDRIGEPSLFEYIMYRTATIEDVRDLFLHRLRNETRESKVEDVNMCRSSRFRHEYIACVKIRMNDAISQHRDDRRFECVVQMRGNDATLANNGG